MLKMPGWFPYQLIEVGHLEISLFEKSLLELFPAQGQQCPLLLSFGEMFLCILCFLGDDILELLVVLSKSVPLHFEVEDGLVVGSDLGCLWL